MKESILNGKWVILGWRHSYLKLKSHLNGYFESNLEKEIILK